jgi:hypothetical protein
MKLRNKVYILELWYPNEGNISDASMKHVEGVYAKEETAKSALAEYISKHNVQGSVEEFRVRY